MAYRTVSTQTRPISENHTGHQLSKKTFVPLLCVSLPYALFLPLFPVRGKRETLRRVKPDTTSSFPQVFELQTSG